MRIDELTLKLICKHTGLSIAKVLLKKSEKRGLGPPGPQTDCCSARVTEGAWPCCSKSPKQNCVYTDTPSMIENPIPLFIK